MSSEKSFNRGGFNQRIREYLAGPGLGPLLIKAAIGSAGLRVVGMFFGFLVGVQLARNLGAEGYGIYGLAMSIIAILTVPTEFGLPQLLTREVAAAQVNNDLGKLRGILKWSSNTVLIISFTVSTAVSAWLLITGHDWDSPLFKTLVAGLIMIPILAQSNLRCAALRGLQQIVKGQLPDSLARPAAHSMLLFLSSLLAYPLSPALAMGLGVISAAFSLILAAFMLQRSLPHNIHLSPPQSQSSKWWASAIPMALTEGMRVLQAHMVILLLGLMVAVEDVGVFRVSSSITLLVAMPVTLLNLVSSPILARLYTQGDRKRSQRLLSWLALSMTCGTIFLILPFVFFGKPILLFAFGPEFVTANEVLLMLCGGVAINGYFGANAALLNMSGHQSQVTRASILSLIQLALFAPPLIAHQGLLGASIAIGISMFTWNILMWRDAKRLLSLDTSMLAFFMGTKNHA